MDGWEIATDVIQRDTQPVPELSGLLVGLLFKIVFIYLFIFNKNKKKTASISHPTISYWQLNIYNIISQRPHTISHIIKAFVLSQNSIHIMPWWFPIQSYANSAIRYNYVLEDWPDVACLRSEMTDHNQLVQN